MAVRRIFGGGPAGIRTHTGVISMKNPHEGTGT